MTNSMTNDQSVSTDGLITYIHDLFFMTNGLVYWW